MDKSFDFDALLKQHTKKHKLLPEQFASVEGGITKRLQKSLKNQKNSRSSVFDNLRNLPKCESPAPKFKNASQKLEHRKQQLEKWKLAKEQKKKEDAKNKKKPFLVGVAHGYLPPPPPPTKPMPSTSGRVTRSQSTRTTKQSINDTKNSSKVISETSFAPPNTSFRPPQIKNLLKYPMLAPITKKNTKKNNTTISFDPILPKKTLKVNVNKTIAAMPTISEKVTETAPKKPVVVENKRVTRSRAADLKSKSDIIVRKPKLIKRIETSTSTSSLEQSKSIEKSPVKITSPRSSRQSINKTPRNSIPKSESSSEEKLRSPKNMLDVPMTPTEIAEESKKISPCVTLSRGKSNARKEMKKKIKEGLLDADASCESVEHFRRQLASETDRINVMCDTWDDISRKIILPDHVQEAVLSAVGQARLLVAQKFQQFAGLLACGGRDCGPALVTPADLAGFWDMLFIQVENVDMRFKKLEELRASGWQETCCDVTGHVPRKAGPRKVHKPAATSRIRDIIAAARKAKQQQQATVAADENKTFEAGFFCVRSPVQSPLTSPRQSPLTSPRPSPLTSPRQKHTLLKAVLSSEAKKASASKNRASLAMLRASMIGKDMSDDSYQSTPKHVPPVDLYATPARSILKSSNKEAARKSRRKSIKVVLFDDTDKQNAPKNDLYPNTTDSKVACISPKNNDVTSLKENNEQNSVKRRSKLLRQQNFDVRITPMLTRSRRISEPNTPKMDEVLTPRRSTRKSVLQELQDNVLEETSVVTPKRSSRTRKSSAAAV